MYKPFDLTGRCAVVTGGNGGIGYGMAEALIAAGARVAIWGSNPEKTAKAKASLGANAEAFVCDVTSEEAVEKTFADSVAALGHVDACFANAGVSSKPTPVLDMTLAEFRRVMQVNVEGVFLTFRAAARHMAGRGQGGALVATASTAAIEGAARNSHYGASKGAVTSYVRALAVELARHRIRVNSILPGWIETEMTARAMGDEMFAKAVLPRIPARRWGTRDDFGAIAVYLMSDGSVYHTGEQFVIDGGYTKF
jgi:hypothetical protein